MSQEHSDRMSVSTAIDGSAVGRQFTNGDLNRIESELKIQLPETYRQFMLAKSKALSEYTYPLRGETELWFGSAFFDLSVGRMIAENASQRNRDMAAAEAFPGWWRKYFFFGTNGGGDYYGMRLDGTPGVWFLDCDGGRIEPYAASLDEFFAKTREGYDEKLKAYMRLEDLYQKKLSGEINEEDFNTQWEKIIDSMW